MSDESVAAMCDNAARVLVLTGGGWACGRPRLMLGMEGDENSRSGGARQASSSSSRMGAAVGEPRGEPASQSVNVK